MSIGRGHAPRTLPSPGERQPGNRRSTYCVKIFGTLLAWRFLALGRTVRCHFPSSDAGRAVFGPHARCVILQRYWENASHTVDLTHCVRILQVSCRRTSVSARGGRPGFRRARGFVLPSWVPSPNSVALQI